MVLTRSGHQLETNFFAGRSILVTGATGFIGRHLVRTLVAHKARVRVLVRLNSTPPATGLDVHVGDLEDAGSLLSACQSIDTVFHVAGFAHAETTAQAADQHWRINAEGTRRILGNAIDAGVKRFVFFSSVLAAGPGGPRCIDEAWPLPPRTCYGEAKRAAEQWVLDAGQRHALHVVNLRPALVYGRGVKGNLQRLLSIAGHSGFPTLPEGGKRSLIHVDDVIRAALLAAAHPTANRQTYILTDGQGYSSRAILNQTRGVLGKLPPIWQIQEPALSIAAKIGDCMTGVKLGTMRFNSETLDKLLGWGWYCSDKIQRELGFYPAHTLAKALPEMLDTTLIR